MFSSLFTALYFLQFFLNQLAVAVGMSFPFTTFLFRSQDIFADSLKLTASYRSFLPADLHWSAPFAGLAPWYATFASYLQNPVYSDNPMLASQQLTHFMLPPFTQLLYIASARLLSFLDPLLFLAAGLLIVSLPACLAMAIRQRYNPGCWIDIVGISLLSYPFLFAVDRAHPVALLCGSLMILSVALFFAGNKKSAILLSLLAINFRPNLFPYLIFFVFSDSRLRLRSKCWNFVGYVALALAAFVGAYLWVHRIYPSYTLTSFLNGYSFYARGEEEANNFTGIGSSLYGAQRLILSGIGLYGPMVPLVLKKLNLFAGVILSLLIALSCAAGKTSILRGLFLTSLLLLVETPLLADYHLLPFLAFFIATSARFSAPALPLSIRSDCDLGAVRRFFIFSPSLDAPLRQLSSLEKVTLCLISVPLAYYILPSRLVSLGAFVRPAMAVLCLLVWVWQGLRSGGFIRSFLLPSNKFASRM